MSDAATKCSLVGSLCAGMSNFASFLVGILIDVWGLQKTTFFGGAIVVTGLLTSSFALGHVEALYVTYGLVLGMGVSLANNSSLIALGHYFHKKLGLVNGLVTTGSPVFSIALPFALDRAFTSIGLATSLQVLAGVIMAVLTLCSLTFPQLPATPVENCEASGADRKKLADYFRRIVNVSIWKNKKYIIWTIAIPFSMFGLFVPYVHLVAYVKDILPDADGKMLMLCIGIASGVGRLVFGKVADLPQVNRIILQQVAIAAMGLLTMLLTVANSFTWLIIISLGMGIFNGCFYVLLGPIAFDLCGSKGGSQALGSLLGLSGIPFTTGPLVAGALYDALGSYQVAFLLAGCFLVTGALILCLISRVESNDPKPGEDLAAIDQEAVKREVSASAATHKVEPDIDSRVNVTASETFQSSTLASGRNSCSDALHPACSRRRSSSTRAAASAAVNSVNCKNMVQMEGFSIASST